MFKKIFLKQKLLVVLGVSLTALTIFAITNLYHNTEAVTTSQPPTEETVVSSQQQTGTVTVKVQSYISPEGNKCYQYTVENNADRPIVRVDIGIEEASDQAELLTLPMWWRQGLISDPTNLVEASDSLSMIEVIGTEDQNNIYVSTKVFRANPGETRGFHVCMQSEWDSTYQTSRWITYMMDGSTRTGQLINLKSIKSLV